MFGNFTELLYDDLDREEFNMYLAEAYWLNSFLTSNNALIHKNIPHFILQFLWFDQLHIWVSSKTEFFGSYDIY